MIDRQDLLIAEIKMAIRQYHLALDQRKHGDVAASHALHRIEELIGMPWKQGEELAKQQ